MRFLYTIVITVILPFALLRLFILGFRNSAYRERWQERLGLFRFRAQGAPVIWLHAVSVGETNAASPLLAKLLQEYPGYRILVTTVTPTGAQTLNMHFGEEIDHLYFPFDLPFIVRRFLNAVQPSLLVLMETEIWPNLCFECKRRQIPVMLINARLSEKSARRYRQVASLTNDTLNNISLIAAQTKNDGERFVLLGMPQDKIVITGNLKFDVAIPQSVSEQSEVIKRYFSTNRLVWIAASTQEGEEEAVLDAHLSILERRPDVILILAPRHPERANKIAALCVERRLKFLRKTDRLPFAAGHQVFLLDTLGELQAHYAAADVAFVGGSLVNRGGQNMMEPASLGIPVLAGPFTYNFTEITQMLMDAGGLQVVHDTRELSELVCKFLDDANLRHDAGEKARLVIKANQGNLPKIMDLFAGFLSSSATYTKNSI